MDKLDLAGNASLALTCKFMASLVMSNSKKFLHVKISPEDMLVHHMIVEGFFLGLNRGWVPQDLQYCRRCGKFRTMSVCFWTNYVKEKALKCGGLAGKNWASVLLSTESNTPNYVKNWCAKKPVRLVCPACDVENP